MEKNFCGKCGIILAKDIDIFDKCPKCQETIEPWNAKAEEMHNINFLSLIVMRMEMPVVRFAKSTTINSDRKNHFFSFFCFF